MMTTDHSESLGALAKALASAQRVMRNARKDSRNPHFKNEYASLASVREAVIGPLLDNGIALVQTFDASFDKGPCVVTMLVHESGEWIRSRLPVPAQKADAQGYGSAISYGRRYALAAICGIAADDDDDGEASVSREPPHRKPTPQPASMATEAERQFQAALEDVSSTEALSKIEAEVARAVQAGQLSDASRTRLRKTRAEVVARLSRANGHAP